MGVSITMQDNSLVVLEYGTKPLMMEVIDYISEDLLEFSIISVAFDCLLELDCKGLHQSVLNQYEIRSDADLPIIHKRVHSYSLRGVLQVARFIDDTWGLSAKF